MVALTLEQLSDSLRAIAALVTALGVMVAGIWAWRRFRRTPESRSKITLRVEAHWEQTPDGAAHVRVVVSATNDGGRIWTLCQDGSIMTCWVHYGTVQGAQSDDVDLVRWGEMPNEPSWLLFEDVRLRPADQWIGHYSFLVAEGALAARVTARFQVDGHEDKVRPVEQSTIVVNTPRSG